MSFSRTTLSLVTILLVFAVLGVGVGWQLLGSTADEGEAAEAPTGQEPDLSGAATPAQFPATVAQPIRGAEVIFDTLWIRVRAAGQRRRSAGLSMTVLIEGIVLVVPVRETRRFGKAVRSCRSTPPSLAGVSRRRAQTSRSPTRTTGSSSS